MNSRQTLAAFAVGFVFALGLALAGMTRPQKVIGFLDPWNWDPSLLFVMIGAVGVHAIAYPLVRRRASPLFDREWHVPTRADIGAKLVIGSAIFGVGWGLGGFCPGPAVASFVAGIGDTRILVFIAAMIAGMALAKRVSK